MVTVSCLLWCLLICFAVGFGGFLVWGLWCGDCVFCCGGLWCLRCVLVGWRYWCVLVFDVACCNIVLFSLSWLLVGLLVGCGWISFVLLLVGFWVCVGSDCACFCDFWISVLWMVCGRIGAWFGFGDSGFSEVAVA